MNKTIALGLLFSLPLQVVAYHSQRCKNPIEHVQITAFDYDKDINQVMKIVEQTKKWTFRGWSEEKIQSFFKNKAPQIKVAKINNKIAGYIVQRISDFMEDLKEVYVRFIAVSKKYRKKGIGKKLLYNTIKTSTKKYRRIHLCVFKNNKNALAFYKKIGFKKIFESPSIIELHIEI